MLSFLQDFNIEDLTGISTDLVIAAMAVLIIILIIVMIINGVKMTRLKKHYNIFMGGKEAMSLEKLLSSRLKKMEQLIDSDMENSEKIRQAMEHYEDTYQKIGLVKYDAFNEQGGRLSFSLCLLNRRNDGFIINAMHSREGCYTYLKEIIQGKPIMMLAEEEKEALEQAIHYKEN